MKEFYRYENLRYSLGVDQFDEPLPGSEIKVELRKFNVVKETPKGVWLGHTWSTSKERYKFVLLSARKRYACPTKEEALESFKARKKRQIKILSNQLESAKKALEIAENNLKSSIVFSR